MTDPNHTQRAQPAQSQAAPNESEALKEQDLTKWRAKRNEKLAAERQLRRRVDRLEKAARYISRVLYPMREELHRLENSRLALERLIFEAEGKVKKCPSTGSERSSRKRTKSANSKEAAAASLLAKLNKSELERLLAQAQARENGSFASEEDTHHE